MVLNLRNATIGEIIRLEHIQKHLKLSSNPEDPGFVQEAIDAAIAKVKPVVKRMRPTNGETLISHIAESFGVHFEEVRSHHDIKRLEKHYLETHREISFAQLRSELNQPGIDALLFQLSKPDDTGNERFVAVLDLRQTDTRAYWDRSHELSHRLAEPPQKSLPFRRHQGESQMPVEKLMDGIAAEIGFYRPLFQPIVSKAAAVSGLTMPTVFAIRNLYAPTASLLSVTNAVTKCWPRPAIVLTAEMGGRRRSPKQDVALRVTPQAINPLARDANLFVPDNMRVPPSSPLFAAFHESGEFTDTENLCEWTSSRGDTLANIAVLTSAFGFRGKAYAVLSVA